VGFVEGTVDGCADELLLGCELGFQVGVSVGVLEGAQAGAVEGAVQVGGCLRRIVKGLSSSYSADTEHRIATRTRRLTNLDILVLVDLVLREFEDVLFVCDRKLCEGVVTSTNLRLGFFMHVAIRIGKVLAE